MKVADNCVVSIHYTLTNNDGKVIDSSDGREPLKYLQGAGNIIPGLERALLDSEVGEQKQVTVQPADGYGEVDANLIQKLPRDLFSGAENIEPGMQFQARGPQGQVQTVTVKEVEDDGVTIDANHELAGVVLNFDVKVEDVREATEEEISHGHVH